jgi:phage recombination protein Bet
MMAERGIIQYKAADGQDVKLSPEIVSKYIITGNGNASPKDVYRFIAQCQARGLNPLAGDAYMTVYNTKEGPRSSVIVSKDYYIRTACAQPDYDGMEAGVVVIDRNGELIYRPGALVGTKTEKLIGGWAKVYSRERSHPSEAVVSLDEYDQHRSLWKTKPATMIRKVAVVQALRDAYPGVFGGVYDASEMPVEYEHIEAEEPVEEAEPVEYEEF